MLYGTTYQHKRPSQKLKNSERLRAILRAILRASQCNLLIFNKHFARKNMKITSNYERIYERTRKKENIFGSINDQKSFDEGQEESGNKEVIVIRQN